MGELIPEATSTRNGLMSTYYPKYYPNALWGTNYITQLVKIATMKKQAGAIAPLIMFFAETYATGVSSMFILSIINRTEGIFSNIKTLGPGSKKGFSFFYKEEDDGSLSIYIRLTNFSEVICIWAYINGIDNYNFTSIPQSSTDTSELTEIQIS